jgi:hypothetical protein
MQLAEGDECGECGAVLMWHSAHTALVCLKCNTALAAPSPYAEARAEAHAEALARHKARASGTLPAIEADPGAEARARTARVELHRAREYLERYAGEMLDMCDGDAYERVQFARLAYGLGATVRGYLPEIKQASDKETCAVIWSELKDIRESDDYRQLTDEAREQNARIERAERAAERAEERERQREAEEREAEVIAAEERRQAEIRARQLAAQQERRQLPAAPIRTPPTTALASSVVSLAEVLTQARAERDKAIAQHGACGFCKKPKQATRVYGIAAVTSGYEWGMQTGTQLDQSAAHVYACDKHQGDADRWLEQNHAGATAYWWET